MRGISKGIITVIVLLLFAALAWGAIPQTINYQGYLKNTDGTPVSSAVNVVFSLYTSSSGGSALWSETRSVTPANGIYSAQLGSVIPFPVGLFGNDILWLGVKVGSDPEMTPRQQLTTAPYAIRAGTADSVDKGLYSNGSYSNPAWLTSLAGSKISGAVASATSSGNASTVTNGLYSNGSYSDPKWLTSLAGSKISGAVASATSAGNASSVTNGVYTTGNYADPSWITSLAGSKITGSVSVAGQVESTSGGFKFPDATVQTTAAAPPWSQILSAADRFVPVMADMAVLDKETGLVWERSTNSTQRTWNEAISYCYTLSLGGRRGWRPPAIEELSSLVDPAQSNPALPAGHPFTNVFPSPYYYWSSTAGSGGSCNARIVDFGNGLVYCGTVPDYYHYVLCVRGGQ